MTDHGTSVKHIAHWLACVGCASLRVAEEVTGAEGRLPVRRSAGVEPQEQGLSLRAASHVFVACALTVVDKARKRA